MSYCGLEFNGFKPRKYKELGESMTKIYRVVDVKIFDQLMWVILTIKILKEYKRKEEHGNDLERSETIASHKR